MSDILRKTGSVLGAAALIGGGITGLAATTPDLALAEQAANTLEQPNQAATTETASALPVLGEFSFTQNATLGNDEIANIFNKASATLCQSLPLYEIEQSDASLPLSVPNASMSVDLSDAEMFEMQDRILGCACATNMPGGGAVMNAEVSGITLESFLAMVSSSVS